MKNAFSVTVRRVLSFIAVTLCLAVATPAQAQQAPTSATNQDELNKQLLQRLQELEAEVKQLKTQPAPIVAATAPEAAASATPRNVESNLENPLALRYKGISITPGGFLAAEFVRRSRALGADINTPLNSITMPGASGSKISEFFGSGRQSRISLLAEAPLKSTKVSAFVETDFLSAGVTSNNNQSNSYTLRYRQAWGRAAFNNGWTFTGGQMWSLVAETRHGVDIRSEALPAVIDPQYTVGFSWARQYGLRVAKNLGSKAWLALSMENPQATLTAHNNASNFLVGSAGASGGLYNLNANYSFNTSPDFVAKVAFEPGFGHYEIYGISSRFRDRVFPCEDLAAAAFCGGSATTGPNPLLAYNSSRDGGGIGANARWPFAHKRVEFGLHALGGKGIGRYGTSGLPDASAHANGTLALMRSYQGLGTLEWHGSKLDIYSYAGAEYVGRAGDYDPITGKPVGYGSPFFNNTGCFSEAGPGAGGFLPGALSNCTADTRVLVEGTAGFWYRLYDGSKEKVNRGRVQFGAQYAYVTRNAWSGVSSPNEPHGIENMVFTSFRYYLP
jgi:hypothetical protein